MNQVYIALIHYPVKKNDQVITSSITNLDLHDISRVAATYGLGGYFVVHPEKSQQMLANTLINHWKKGRGKEYNPDRFEAFKKIHIVSTLGDAKREIFEREGVKPLTVGNSAIKNKNSVPLKVLKKYEKKPLLFLFGTAGGLSDQLVENIDIILDPIEVGTGYNHLSVRSAVAIFIDRLANTM